MLDFEYSVPTRILFGKNKTNMIAVEIRNYASNILLVYGENSIKRTGLYETIIEIFKDNGISGTQESRPALNELMNDARKKRFDVLLCWRFDRVARSTRHLINILHELRNLGIDFISFQENVDTSNHLGEFFFTVISAMSKLERDIIAERVKGGLRRAQANGKKLGRPNGNVDIDKVIDYKKQGKSIREIAKEMKLSRGKVERTLKLGVTKTLEACMA